MDLIGSQVLVTKKSKRYQGQLLHFDPTSKMILLQAENLMIFNQSGYDLIEPCYEQFSNEITFYEPIPLLGTIQDKKLAILDLAKEYVCEIQGETIVIDSCCWIDPPYDKITCPDPNRFQKFTKLLDPIL
jgi:small nuclear ribonucleoprotein (snRNP)-like protein